MRSKVIELAQILPERSACFCESNILMAATLQYIASLPEAWYLEFCEQDTELRQKLTTPIFTIDSEGYVEIPQRPGLGIDIDWDVFDYYKVDK